jgi:hypothetical protein
MSELSPRARGKPDIIWTFRNVRRDVGLTIPWLLIVLTTRIEAVMRDVRFWHLTDVLDLIGQLYFTPGKNK